MHRMARNKLWSGVDIKLTSIDKHQRRLARRFRALDRHYLGDRASLAENAIRRLERKERRTKPIRCKTVLADVGGGTRTRTLDPLD